MKVGMAAAGLVLCKGDALELELLERSALGVSMAAGVADPSKAGMARIGDALPVALRSGERS